MLEGGENGNSELTKHAAAELNNVRLSLEDVVCFVIIHMLANHT